MKKIHSVIDLLVVLIIQSFSLLVGASHNGMSMPQNSGYVVAKDFTFTGQENTKAIIISPLKADDAQLVAWDTKKSARDHSHQNIFDLMLNWFDVYYPLFIGTLSLIFLWTIFCCVQRTHHVVMPAAVHLIPAPPAPFLPAEIERAYMNFAAMKPAFGA